MKRIVHITTLPQTAASFLHGQMRWLRNHGYDVTVMSSPGEQLSAFAAQEGVRFASVEMLRAISPVHDCRAILRLTQQLRSIKPHIVHAHTPKAGLIAMIAAKLAGVPCRAYHQHGLKFETATGVRRQILKRAEQVTCHLADRVFCVSDSLRRKAMDENLFPASKSRVLGQGSINGLDVDAFNRGVDHKRLRRETRERLGVPQEAPCLGFIGRLVRDKGIEDLQQAWLRLREMHPALHLLLVGPFEEQDPVNSKTRSSLEEDPRVHLTGLDWNAKPYFCAMDVFTLPSYREGLPYVALEAAAMQLPVVSCRVTGCVDAIVDGVTGRLVEAGDSNGLVESLDQYLNDAALRSRDGRAGQEHVRRRFSPRVIWQALLSEYHEILTERGLETSDAPTIRAA